MLGVQGEKSLFEERPAEKGVAMFPDSPPLTRGHHWIEKAKAGKQKRERLVVGKARPLGGDGGGGGLALMHHFPPRPAQSAQEAEAAAGSLQRIWEQGPAPAPADIFLSASASSQAGW